MGRTARRRNDDLDISNGGVCPRRGRRVRALSKLRDELRSAQADAEGAAAAAGCEPREYTPFVAGFLRALARNAADDLGYTESCEVQR